MTMDSRELAKMLAVQRAEIEWLREALNEAIKEKNWLAKELADCQQLCDYLAGANR